MNILSKIVLKSKIEVRFLLEQKWGLKKPRDLYSIPKYLLKRYLPSAPVIVDCGAHIGADSVELAKIFPSGKIYSFEPIPELFAVLQRNTRKYKNISCYQLALSDKNGNAMMYASSGASDASSSLLEPAAHVIDHPGVFFHNRIEVVTQTLDSWSKENNIGAIDFLWLDMQGFEYYCLKASPVSLSSVKVIHTEVSIGESYKGSMTYKDFSNWLSVHGFAVAAEAVPEGSDMGNVLFVRQ